MYPHKQEFNRKAAIENQGSAQARNLLRRRADYSAMIARPDFKGASGYHRPGSNKK